MVREAVGRGIDVAFARGDDSVPILVHPSDFCGVGLEETVCQVPGAWLEGHGPRVHVQQDLVRQSTGNEALAKLALGLNVGIEEIGVAWAVRVVAVNLRVVRFPRRSGARNDRLERADLTVLQRIRGCANLIRESAREG